MTLIKSKVTNLDNKLWFSFVNRQAFFENKDNYNFKSGDLVIFYNSSIVWKIKI